MTRRIAFLFVTVVLLADQLLKIYIKTHFTLGESIEVFSWFKISFIENEGMAWGAKIPGSYGKLILSIFRIGAIAMLFLWIKKQIFLPTTNKGLQIALLLVLSGAIGNMIDSAVYGLIFTEGLNQPAIFSLSENYGYFLLGKVVDMFYFPIWEGFLPDWIPIWGGSPFTFFNAIFNVADSAISVGLILLLIFYKKRNNKPLT